MTRTIEGHSVSPLAVKGLDLFVQVRTVTWGGGKISSTHPYNALECQARQLLQGSTEFLMGLEIPLHPEDQLEAHSAKDRCKVLSMTG